MKGALTWKEIFLGFYVFIACCVLWLILSQYEAQYEEEALGIFDLALGAFPLAAIDAGIVTVSKITAAGWVSDHYWVLGGIFLNLLFLLGFTWRIIS